MQKTTHEQRYFMGCGFQPLHDVARPWSPPIGGKGYAHARPTTCAGYTTNLPQVIEAARSRLHWEKGQLEHFTGGAPSELLLEAVEIINGAIADVHTWAMTREEDGGGRAS